jgi:ribose-phosphate pyrophosphokinase
MSTKDFVIFAGSSNKSLALDICNELGIQLGDCNIEYFANTEARPVIANSVRGKHVFIVQSGNSVKRDNSPDLSINDILMEMLLMVDACKRSGSRNVTLLMPTYPYSRQDKKDSPRAAISARLVANMIMSTDAVKRIVCTELHNPCIQGFFNISVDNLYTIDLIVEFLRNSIFPQEVRDFISAHPSDSYDYPKQFVVVAPDEGGFKRASIFADKLELPFLGMSKNRDVVKKNTVKNITILGDPNLLRERTVLILDDMIDTCGTCLKTVDALSNHGIKDVILCATHGVLSDPAIDRINRCDLIKYVIVSDSLDQSKNSVLCDKIRTFTISKMYAEVVRRLIEGRSISEIFIK